MVVVEAGQMMFAVEGAPGGGLKGARRGGLGYIGGVAGGPPPRVRGIHGEVVKVPEPRHRAARGVHGPVVVRK